MWAFEGQGKITDIVGGYSDYEAYAAYLAEQEKQLQQIKQEKPEASSQQEKPQKKSNKLSYKLKLELEELPSKVEQLEKALDAQQIVVNDPDFFKQDAVITTDALNQLAQLESELEAAFERWEELEDLKNQ